MRYRQEITEWDKAPNTPNHVYITEGKVLVGFVPFGSNKVQMFKKAKKQWSPTRRKFRDLTQKEIDKLEHI